MLTFNTRFEKELLKLLEKEIEERKDQLSTGLATVDFETYRHQVGIIKGIRLAIELCEEAMKLVAQRDDN